jgi:hypothetical protein
MQTRHTDYHWRDHVLEKKKFRLCAGFIAKAPVN